MDREQHVVQDAGEHYAVYLMQKVAEDLGRAGSKLSTTLEAAFLDYLREGGLEPSDFEAGAYKQYKRNADIQLPRFVARLAEHYPGHQFDFLNVEKEYRNLGKKADFTIVSSELEQPLAVSLKNYMGQGGISRPQVSAGTFLSFTLSFLFERAGSPGMYRFPGKESETFKGSTVPDREKAIEALGLSNLTPLIRDLDHLQAAMRDEFLGPECEMYDKERVAAAAKRIAEPSIETVLSVFQTIGLDQVRDVILERVGFDGKEELLYFDERRYVDSITSLSFRALKEKLTAPQTQVRATHRGQSIQFEFLSNDEVILTTDVPFTINTNGAWYRPKEKFDGTRPYKDKGHIVDLAWGQRRPYKSREIATSINTYVNLESAGIFG